MTAEPHFDADDNFIHRCCECGEEALFGYGVSLRPRQTWNLVLRETQAAATNDTNN